MPSSAISVFFFSGLLWIHILNNVGSTEQDLRVPVFHIQRYRFTLSLTIEKPIPTKYGICQGRYIPEYTPSMGRRFWFRTVSKWSSSCLFLYWQTIQNLIYFQSVVSITIELNLLKFVISFFLNPKKSRRCHHLKIMVKKKSFCFWLNNYNSENNSA